ITINGFHHQKIIFAFVVKNIKVPIYMHIERLVNRFYLPKISLKNKMNLQVKINKKWGRVILFLFRFR
ncbi:MAG: hypothetical protein RIR01_2457, partial [Bacteroidota bacterium]